MTKTLIGVIAAIAFFGGAPRSNSAEFYYVPTESVAIKIAEAILEPIIGPEHLEDARPLKASLQGDFWEVYTASKYDKGRSPKSQEPQWIVKIDRRTGAILGIGVGI